MHPLSTPGYQRLLELQRRIHDHTMDLAVEYGEGQPGGEPHPLWTGDYLAVSPMRDGLHVEFFGEVYGEPLEWVLECLAEQPVADCIRSLAFTGPDEGANGTREWEFTTLLDSPVTFPQLRALFIRPTAPEDHNASLVQQAGSIMEEEGEIARFAAKAPLLAELTVPNAPDASFFEVPLPHLNNLRIGGGYDTQRFIDNFAASNNLPALGLLDFTECTELQFTWADRRGPDAVTSFQSYEALMRSAALEPVHTFRLRNCALCAEQLQHLHALRPGLQFMVIQAAQGGYVSHFAKNLFPWRHLVPGDTGVK